MDVLLVEDNPGDISPSRCRLLAQRVECCGAAECRRSGELRESPPNRSRYIGVDRTIKLAERRSLDTALFQ
jgi:hypothetical protein